MQEDENYRRKGKLMIKNDKDKDYSRSKNSNVISNGMKQKARQEMVDGKGPG